MIRRKNPYLYAVVFLIIILLILIGNGFFTIHQTRSNLIDIYWKQGELVEETIALSVQRSIESIKLNNRQIFRHIKKISGKIDKLASTPNKLNEEELETFLIDNSLTSIQVKNPSGKIISAYPPLPFSEPGFRQIITEESLEKNLTEDTNSSNSQKSTQKKQSNPFPTEFTAFKTIIINMDKHKGSIHITIDSNKLEEIKVRIGLQVLIVSLENRNIIRYISFFNDQLKNLADSKPSKVGSFGERQELVDSLQNNVSYFFFTDNIMEIIHPVTYLPGKKGIFQMAFPTTEIDKIYNTTLRDTITYSVMAMLALIVATAIVVKILLVSSGRVEQMQKKLRENEKLVSLANLAAGVAHEVRNPLNSISITIQRLQLEFLPANEDDHEEYQFLTSTMNKEVHRINNIITDFLGFSKPFDPQNATFEIVDLLNEITSLFESETNKKGVTFIKKIHPTLDRFYGDREKLTQVLLNILHNSLDATPKGGAIVFQSTESKSKDWIWKVIDNGEGIPKAKLPHVFDIYFTTKSTGSGLGLYISRKIINAHSGTIEIKPNHHKGTITIVSLPKQTV